jgi:hypothetical protein
MWSKITGFIIRNRFACLVVVLVLSGIMGYIGREVKLSYDFPKIIPQSDSDYVYYQRFKKVFGEDNDLMIAGFNNQDVFQKDILNDWYRLGFELRKIKGVNSVGSVATLANLKKDTASRRFIVRPFMQKEVSSQEEADSLKDKLLHLPFYKGLFYEDSTHSTLMAVQLNPQMLVSKDRIYLIDSMEQAVSRFAKRHSIEVHYSGMPYIRTIFTQKMQREINFFLILSIAVTALVLLIFFRSIYAVVFPIGLFGVVIAWTLGIIVLFGYKLTLLTGLIPPLIAIIAVPNFIYFLTRYHTEYKKYNNKYVAIIRMVQNIARVVFLNNTTTAIGFGVLYFVDSPMLKEFGVVAFLMIVTTYFATLILMPIIFSYLPAPSPRQVHYLNNPFMSRFMHFVDWLVHKKRQTLYAVTVIIAGIAIFGLTKLHAVGYIMDDIPEEDRLSKDLAFFENNFKGIMPLDIIIDTKKKNGLLDTDYLSRIEQLQDTLEAMPAFASTLSVADVAKYANQAFYNGMESRYRIPTKREKVFLYSYLMGMRKGNNNAVNAKLWDTAFQQARISTRMADVGSRELKKIIQKLDSTIPKIFEGMEVGYRFTGFSLIFLKGNGYLIKNLISSIIMAIALIIVVIAFLFPSFRLVVITLVPNILALLITAGIMGYFGVPLKPSTVLVFSIAFGIAVDASFHFLVTYRQDLKLHNWDISKTVTIALRQTGFGVIYTSLVLFFGFGIFCFSNFGSTISLGALTSITLLCAMFTNIILIPALLISFDKKGNRLKLRRR